jgi:5'-nucleotidase / UDP-sugar diphosphatase
MAKISRRKFLGVLGTLGVGALLPGNLRGSGAGGVRISVIHTTDIHAHILPTTSYQVERDLGGFARCATQIRRWREANPACVLLDAGDLLQGTDVGWRTRGQVMVRCLNALRYDGWTIGNHEFDWGMEPLAGCLEAFHMPALSANALLEGKLPGQIDPSQSPLGHIRPSLLKEVAGFKIGVIGLTTPGLPYWFQPSFTMGYEVGDPAEAARREAEILRASGADAIVLLAHMGRLPGGDNFANRLDSVAAAVPDAALIIGGHTHRDIPSDTIRGIPYTQAAYHGLNIGRADLVFDAASRKLVGIETSSLRMTPDIPADAAVLSLVGNDLDASHEALDAPAGIISETLSAQASFGRPSDVERLIASSIFAALEERGVTLDAVWHGVFTREALTAGPKTVRDIWSVIPYENFIITGEITPDELIAAITETYRNSRTPSRSLIGMRLKFSESGNPTDILAIEDRTGRPLDRGKRYRIAMNTYDASSGGGRMLKLRDIMRTPDARATIHPVQSREALVGFLSKHGDNGVRKSDLLAGVLLESG